MVALLLHLLLKLFFLCVWNPVIVGEWNNMRIFEAMAKHFEFLIVCSPPLSRTALVHDLSTVPTQVHT